MLLLPELHNIPPYVFTLILPDLHNTPPHVFMLVLIPELHNTPPRAVYYQMYIWKCCFLALIVLSLWYFEICDKRAQFYP